MSTIKTVAIAGASGSLGAVIFQKLISSGKFTVTVLRRTGTTSEFPGARVVDVDYSSPDSLKTALAGQDAVVAALGSTAIDVQFTLIDAAVAAGVRRFLPSDFGSDLDNPNTRALLVQKPKAKVQDRLIEASKTSGLTYTFVYNGAFLDWGVQTGFLLNIADYKPTLFDEGKLLFSATTLGSVGDAVVGVLTHPEETKNRSVRVENVVTSQAQLLALAKKAAPGKPWEPTSASLNAMVAAADAKAAKGEFDRSVILASVYRGILGEGYGGKFEQTDNELLGIEHKTDADVEEILKSLIV